MDTNSPALTIVYVASALKELDHIWDYNAEFYSSADHATDYINFLKDEIKTLALDCRDRCERYAAKGAHERQLQLEAEATVLISEPEFSGVFQFLCKDANLVCDSLAVAPKDVLDRTHLKNLYRRL